MQFKDFHHAFEIHLLFLKALAGMKNLKSLSAKLLSFLDELKLNFGNQITFLHD